MSLFFNLFSFFYYFFCYLPIQNILHLVPPPPFLSLFSFSSLLSISFYSLFTLHVSLSCLVSSLRQLPELKTNNALRVGSGDEATITPSHLFAQVTMANEATFLPKYCSHPLHIKSIICVNFVGINDRNANSVD